jgi:hypothetical protein
MGEFFPLKMLPLTKPRKIEKRKWEKICRVILLLFGLLTQLEGV